jgi:hypothetical protein
MNNAQTQQLPATQAHLNLLDIKDNLVILKDGTIALVLQTTSVNFDLLSEFEQDSKILAFSQMLNSLTHPTQIIIRTRKVDITGYLFFVKSFLNKQIMPGLRRQINIYLKFIQNLITRNEVLDKTFYIIIPFRTLMIQNINPLAQLKKKAEMQASYVERTLDQAKAYLYPKRDHVMKQLIRMGLQSHQLTTKELVELYYDIYNPPASAVSEFTQEHQDSSEVIKDLSEKAK